MPGNDYFELIGRIGGSRKSRRKKSAARRNAQKPRFSARKRNRKDYVPHPRPRKPRNVWWHNGNLAVRAETIGLANREVRRVDRSVKLGDLRRSWTAGKPNKDLPEVNGVYFL